MFQIHQDNLVSAKPQPYPKGDALCPSAHIAACKLRLQGKHSRIRQEDKAEARHKPPLSKNKANALGVTVSDLAQNSLA